MGNPLPFDTAAAFAEMREQVSANQGLFQGNQSSVRQKLLDAEVEQREQRLLRARLAEILRACASTRCSST
ncbi:MAG: hypothetical protein WDM77_02205 [Steroidobacteraceae bacterium]